MSVDESSEFVGHDEFVAAILLRHDIEDERATVGVGATTCVPILVAAAPESAVLGGKTLEHRVNDLLFRAAEGDTDVASLIGEYLGPKHASICDAHQSVDIAGSLCDDEEPRPVG